MAYLKMVCPRCHMKATFGEDGRCSKCMETVDPEQLIKRAMRKHQTLQNIAIAVSRTNALQFRTMELGKGTAKGLIHCLLCGKNISAKNLVAFKNKRLEVIVDGNEVRACSPRCKLMCIHRENFKANQAKAQRAAARRSKKAVSWVVQLSEIERKLNEVVAGLNRSA